MQIAALEEKLRKERHERSTNTRQVDDLRKYTRQKTDAYLNTINILTKGTDASETAS